jgi:periplasmic divalent cation tolerance protein
VAVASDLIVILCTAPDEATAKSLAEGLVGARLAACVSAIPGATSTYRWQGKVEQDSEVQLLIKTRAERFDAVAGWIGDHHPYDTPEIVALPAERVSESYAEWLRREV